ncbi:DNA primase [Candidatus Campbellbacteria bacterium CG11_big_fil_rev_8_21_14_0_20_44_21]|uniref:DNA primase n=1 Tax=Candidatus Campbellbacteria bacterium CG22_combo_CG10-13_8_21_14_all_43_18 TaxID=1974530 RepID=A0A2H0DVY9_9BACT|nr:MAG: DNA primase [Candidatus Campbellbacteria bacterium CG22_combo_CG10-13_8_21_14_all_43_18]PIR24051.1 MAG: DNA primase [Candidatus Campbellbacteria bacterium CG11_big_fil_rev_8_21_14_0_20_44_21]
MASAIEQIKNRLSVVDVIGSYLKLQKAGANFKSRCPFHNEKTPSFFVSPERDSYYCFGCGRRGDIFDFVQEFEGMDFAGSLKILADKAGVEIKKGDFRKKNKDEKLFSVIEEARGFYEEKLAQNKDAQKYLKERGLKEEIIREFKIGFAPDSWRELKEFLLSKSFREEEMLSAGLLKSGDRGGYDTFRGRIMFNINDASGRTIAFSGRILKDREESAKYINSPETEIFKKSKTLFAYDKAKFEMRKKDFAILVEGTVDAIMAHQAGYRNTVAPLGTALTKEQLEKIARITKKLVMAFDSDSAGLKASARGAKMALAMGFDLKVAAMPKSLDPADLIKADVQAWKKSIRHSKHIIEFYLQRIQAEESDRRKLNLRAREEILPFVAQIANKIDQAHFIKVLSETLQISEEAVYSEVGKIDFLGLEVSSLRKDSEKESKKTGKKETIVRKICGLILWQESLKDTAFETSFGRKELLRIAKGENLFENFDEKMVDEIVFEANILYENDTGLKKEFEELLLRLEEEYLRKELSEKMAILKDTEKEGGEKEERILRDCQNLSKSISKIRSKFNHY